EAGYHLFAAVRKESDGATSDLSNKAILKYDPNAMPLVVARINAGGEAYTDTQGNQWSADQYSTGGSCYPGNCSDLINVAIANTSDDFLYQSERYGTMGYAIPVPVADQYIVRLHFAEIYHGVSTPNGTGARVFDVSIEGTQVLNDYDIVADVGPSTAVVKEYTNVAVNDGTLNINFTTLVDNAKVSAIEVLRFGDG